jgi:uncharacterized protein YaaN involved in tellurite resistance
MSQELKITESIEEQPIVLSAEEQEKVARYKSQLNILDTNSIIQFGASSQNQMVSFSSSVLEQVRTKNLGEVGDTLSRLVSDIKSFDANLDGKSFFDLFRGLKKRIDRLIAKYTTVEDNVNKVEIQMEKHYQTLQKDINMLEFLFAQNHQYYRDLTLYIHAGEERINEIQSVELPGRQSKASSGNDPQLMQQTKDLEGQLHRFEKKLHDLKLSRMISLQLAPQIRLVQNNSATLMGKIHSTMVNTLPLWKNQMVLSLGLVHSKQALEAQRSVNEATNKLLRKNSELLRTSSAQIAKENEQSIVDIETIRKVNNDLFAAIDEIIQIQQEGRAKRLAAETELRNAETELRNKFTKAKTD